MPEALIHSAAVQNDVLCRVLGECRSGPPLDSELGDLVGGAGLLAEPLFSYVRYDAETHPDSLEQLGVGHLSTENLDQIDGVDFIDEMCEFGRAVATRVEPAHFDGFVHDEPGGGAPGRPPPLTASVRFLVLVGVRAVTERSADGCLRHPRAWHRGCTGKRPS